jgi:hypothetical protein
MNLEVAQVAELGAMPDGGALLAASFDGKLELGGQTLEGHCETGEWRANLALVRLDAQGKTVWSKTLPCSEPTALAVDAAGGSVLAALFGGVVDLGDGPIKPQGGGRDLLLLRIAPDGTLRWKHTLALPIAQRISDLGFDPNGNLYYTGGLMGGAPLGAAKPPPLLRDKVNLMLGKLDASGTPIFGRVFPSIVWQTPRLEVGPGGETYVSATLHSHRVDLGAGRVGTEGGMFVARFSPKGEPVWSKVFGQRPDAIHDLGLDPQGSVLFIGETASSVDFGGGALGQGSEEHAAPVVARLDPSGAHLESRALFQENHGLSSASGRGTSVAVGPKGEVFVAGRVLAGDVDLGAGNLGSSAADFVASLGPSLTPRWSTFNVVRERVEPTNHHLAADTQGGLLLAYDVTRKLRSGGATHGLVVARFAP